MYNRLYLQKKWNEIRTRKILFLLSIENMKLKMFLNFVHSPNRQCFFFLYASYEIMKKKNSRNKGEHLNTEW